MKNWAIELVTNIKCENVKEIKCLSLDTFSYGKSLGNSTIEIFQENSCNEHHYCLHQLWFNWIIFNWNYLFKASVSISWGQSALKLQWLKLQLKRCAN